MTRKPPKPGAPAATSSSLLSRLRGFNEASLAITAELSSARLLQTIVETAKDVIGARYAALEEHNDKGDLLLFVHAGMPPEVVAKINHLPRGLGLLGLLLRDPRPVRVSDISQDPRSVGFPPNHPPMKSLLGVPVVSRGKILGNLYFADKIGATAFSEEDEQLAIMLAAHAGVAIDNARLYSETNTSLSEKVTLLEQAERRARFVAELGELLTRSFKIETVLPEVAKKTVEVLGDFCAIGVLRPGDGRDLEMVAVHGMDYTGLGSGRMFLEQARVHLLQRVVGDGATVFVPHVQSGSDAPEHLRTLMSQFKFTSGLAVPLRGHERVVGVLVCLGYFPKVMGNPDLALAKLVAERVSVAIDSAMLYRTVETEHRQLLAVVDHSPAGIVIVDAKTGVAAVNRMTERILGREVPAMATRDYYLDQVRRPDGSQVSTELLPSSRALRGETVLGEEMQIVRDNGETQPVLLNAAPVRDESGDIVAAVATIQDITALKALEKLREEFTAIVAHDLKVPISVIAGYAQILEELLPEEHTRDKEKRAIRNIRVSAQRLAAMVTDLLDATRIETNRVSLNKRLVNLAELTRDVVERTVAITDEHKLRLEIGEGFPVTYADPDRVEQVLGNLLSNAVKYSYPGTDISIRVWVHGNQARLSVTNLGPGIPKDEWSRVFTRFHRRRTARESQVSGLGLGLYIAKGLVESHGGRIWLESEVGEFATFHVGLPLLEDREADVRKQPLKAI